MIPNEVPNVVEHLFNVFNYNLKNGLYIMTEVEEAGAISFDLQSSFRLPNSYGIRTSAYKDIEALIRSMFEKAGHQVKYLAVYPITHTIEDVEVDFTQSSHYAVHYVHFNITYSPKEIA